MSEKPLNDEVENYQSGKRKMPVYKTGLTGPLIIAIALLLVLITSTMPLLPQTRIIITTDRDIIKNLFVENPRVPLIISLFPSPSVGVGAYTIKVEVSKNGALVFNSTLQDVPSGEYTFVWVSYGSPETGSYHISVKLLRASMEVDDYSLDVDF